MASTPLSSETEIRLFNQVCEAIRATGKDQRNVLKSFIREELSTEWARLVALMDSDGPLSILSEDEMKFFTTLYLSGNHDLQDPSHREADMFSQVLPGLTGQKATDNDLIKAAIHDLLQYNSVLEKLLMKYNDYVRRSIANMKRSSEPSDKTSMVGQKVAELSLRKAHLQKEIHLLEGKIGDQVNEFRELAPVEPGATKAGSDLHGTNLKSAGIKEIFETTLPSHDRILSKLNALHHELGHDAIEDDELLHVARRHANQIVLSLATKCRASLDTVFLEASRTYNKRASRASNHAQTINDERVAVYAEIQSLWDEMVPLAHMVVEKEFLNPILKTVETCSEKQSLRDATICTYTTAMLRFMNERLSLIVHRIEMLVYHHQTLCNAFTHANNKITFNSSRNMGPARAHSRQNKGSANSLLENIKRQMEMYGAVPIDIESQSQSLSTITPQTQVTKLDRYFMSRQKKGNELARSVQNFFEMVTKIKLTDAELGNQLLLDSIVADSAAAGCQAGGHVYEDQQVEDSVATMKSQADEIQAIFAELRGPNAPYPGLDFVAYAYNKTAKRHSHKDSETKPDDQERCLKLEDLLHKWGDGVDYVK